MRKVVTFAPRELPVANDSSRSPAWWGIWTLIATEAALFGYLLFSYFYLVSRTGQNWPPEGLPSIFIPGISTLFLLTSSFFVWLCEKMVKKEWRGWSMLAMGAAIILGTVFVGLQLHEWGRKTYNVVTHLYGSLYFTITGFHMAHVVIGLVMLCLLLVLLRFGYFNPQRRAGLAVIGLYWHFVDAVWLFIFSSLYISPYVFGGG